MDFGIVMESFKVMVVFFEHRFILCVLMTTLFSTTVSMAAFVGPRRLIQKPLSAWV